jgi:hypothetical protein
MSNIFLTGADTSGDVQCFNVGTNDDSTPIYYELETQEIELGDRFHNKTIHDKIEVLSEDGHVHIKQDEEDYKPLEASKFDFHYLSFKWFGNTINLSPVLDGFYIKEVIDNG